MVKLKDIVNKASKTSANLLNLSNQKISGSSALATKIESSLAMMGYAASGIDSKQQAQFSVQAAEMVTDDKFLDDLQDRIGKPHENETEDAFVIRAKERMRELLKANLK